MRVIDRKDVDFGEGLNRMLCKDPSDTYLSYTQRMMDRGGVTLDLAFGKYETEYGNKTYYPTVRENIAMKQMYENLLKGDLIKYDPFKKDPLSGNDGLDGLVTPKLKDYELN